MIVRTWRGQTTAETAAAHHRHFTGHVVPSLRGIAGHRGAFLLRRETERQVEFLAVTLWESLATIRNFAGDDTETAVIEPEARAVLTEFDPIARHYRLAYPSDPSCASD